MTTRILVQALCASSRRVSECGWTLGEFIRRLNDRAGRRPRLPPQLGQTPLGNVAAHAAHHVHSKEQI